MISMDDMRLVLGHALGLGADFAELFFEDKEDVSVNFNGAVDGVASMRTYGAGVYLICGTRGVYVYTNSTDVRSLFSAVERAAALMRLQAKGGAMAPELVTQISENPCPVAIYPGTVAYADKIALLRDADAYARSLSRSLHSIKLTYTDRDQRITVANSEGLFTEDRRVTSRIRIVPVISTAAGTASRFSEYCAAAGFEAFGTGAHHKHMENVLRDMEESITAREAPSARVSVILEGGGCTGTFFHEACGHQLETTALVKGGIFAGKQGERIASEKVTLIDDGTMPGMYGSSRIDDEGMPRRKNILITNGVLTGCLADRLGALRLGVPRTGSGRRQDYAHAPGARMSNTYLAPGDDDDDAILRDTDEGLFVTEIGGGTGGREFTLLASTAYWVKHGEIVCRVKGAMLTGRGDETMKKIDRVGRKFIAEEGGGSFCGAESGFCATTTSGPRMRIAGMVVGGKGGAI